MATVITFNLLSLQLLMILHVTVNYICGQGIFVPILTFNNNKLISDLVCQKVSLIKQTLSMLAHIQGL